ncbi:MAG: bifunctional precorrin-2 dehydrogenase/sirohydrochlorin ferrochelatase [Gemmataceae bacterium]
MREDASSPGEYGGYHRRTVQHLTDKGLSVTAGERFSGKQKIDSLPIVILQFRHHFWGVICLLTISLDLSARLVVIVGAGSVGRRKAVACSVAGAWVRMIDPRPRPDGFTPAGVEWVAEAYRPAHLEGAWLAFAAGPPEVNAAVVADATARRLWVCDAADPGRGGVVLPAVGHAGRVTVAVGTGGASPRLAARLRDEIVAGLDPAYPVWADLLAEVRPEVRAAVAAPAERRRVLADLADPRWLEAIRADGAEAVRARMRAGIGRVLGGSSASPSEGLP